ncbi:acetyltransferase (GNAT) family protein [Mucilaginibacter gracilis]|uniref:Acetyltransferase (GNAT) family protein n=1 Tax=Mucilaginibacter gracilis TaxID=423350 RepID=A0A495IU12_9SPHI|nr:GNAT family N-acetyltransferase [Mucilaginibacter gracilis]RKR80247.1 acetyltransferase (GNAT) family protein [Mucilaginibacter gracilis]
MLHIEQITPQLTWRLRHEVLYPDIPIYKMWMDEDDDGYHFGAFTESELVAVVSLFSKGSDFQFRKFAVHPSVQGRGMGKALLNYVIAFAKAEGAQRLWCNARLPAIGFYLKSGFKQTGETFSKNGFDYEIMELMLN